MPADPGCISRREAMALLAGAVVATSFGDFASAAAPGTSPTLPPAVRDALAATAAQVAPITLRWTSRSQSGTSLNELAKALSTAPPNPADRWTNEHRHYRVTFQDGLYRAGHHEEPREPREAPDLNESAFDGTFLTTGRIAPPMDGQVQTMYLKRPLSTYTENDEAQYLSTDLLDYMGVRLPVKVKDLKAKSPVRSEILSLLEQGATVQSVEETQHDGRRVIRLRIVAPDPQQSAAARADLNAVREELSHVTDPAEVDRVLEDIKRQRAQPAMRTSLYYLDPAINYAIVRIEHRWEPDRPLSRTTMSEFEKLEGRDVHVPRKIVLESYNHDPVPPGVEPVPVQTRTTTVDAIDIKPKPPATFAIAYNEPGTNVYVNDDQNKQKRFVVKADGTLGEPERRRRPR